MPITNTPAAPAPFLLNAQLAHVFYSRLRTPFQTQGNLEDPANSSSAINKVWSTKPTWNTTKFKFIIRYKPAKCLLGSQPRPMTAWALKPARVLLNTQVWLHISPLLCFLRYFPVRADPGAWSLKPVRENSIYKLLTANTPPTLSPLLIPARQQKGVVFKACGGTLPAPAPPTFNAHLPNARTHACKPTTRCQRQAAMP